MNNINPIIPGKVDIDIIFGTNFDYINIPYSKTLLRSNAKKIMSFTSYIEWQSSRLSTIRLNIDNFEEIEGAQFIEVKPKNSPTYIYIVLGYYQLNKKCVEIGLMYDPLLSIGINNITAVHGILRRWTVKNDAPFSYTFTSEPLNQIAPYKYEYFKVNNITNANTFRQIVGFPVDLTTAPEITQYTNPDDTVTNIYYPLLSTNISPTTFTINFDETNPLDTIFNDGLRYQWWTPGEENKSKTNYNLAVALGYNLISSSYLLPYMTNYTLNFSNDGITLNNITGNIKKFNNPMTLFNDDNNTYNNQKTQEIGVFFALYNIFSGDNVIINNYDLTDTNVTVYCNPYINGGLYARFDTYKKDVFGLTGLVKSIGYSPATLTSDTGYNATTNAIDAMMKANNISTYETTQKNNIEMERNIAWNNAMQQGLNSGLSVGLNAVDFMATGNPMAVVSGGINAAQNIVNQVAMAANASQRYSTQMENLNLEINLQRQNLNLTGTLGVIQPPLTKYAETTTPSLEGYNFVVQKAYLSDIDLKVADIFFTAYGYNVSGITLSNTAQLNCRKRFTFIMADDVTINSTYPEKFRNLEDLQYIKTRFANGLRIWQVAPNYDYTILNEVM